MVSGSLIPPKNLTLTNGLSVLDVHSQHLYVDADPLLPEVYGPALEHVWLLIRLCSNSREFFVAYV